jgi:hypothetical protein
MKTAAEKSGMDEARPGFMRVLAVRWDWALGLALLMALPFGGQSASGSGQSSRHTPVVNVDENLAGDARDPQFEERRLRRLSIAQYKSMVSDTDKLLKLVTELNTEISRTNPSALTPDELRKVAEIEKLARSVKDKMRISLKEAPVFMDSLPIPPVSHR